jgi:hypothetical protein
MEPYRVVCLFQTAKALPDDFLTALEKYVNDGGGLAVVPPARSLSSDELKKWNDALDKHHLMTAALSQLVSAPEGQRVYWDDFKDNNPLTMPFYEWKRGVNPDFADEAFKPFVKRYWEVTPVEGQSLVISSYGAGGSPALVELKRGETPGEEKRGRILLFTTRLDRPDSKGASDRDWHNFYDGSFGMVLINEACKYLAGDSSMENPNYLCGPPVVLPLPASAPRGVYRLNTPDPDLTESERSITVDAKDTTLEVRKTAAPGPYSIFDPSRNLWTAFSLNVSPEESRLDRLPAEEIEKALGPGSVLTAAAGVSLNGALRDRSKTATTTAPQPARVDLLPLLMMLTLLFLTFEGLLANRFYERPSPSPSSAAGGPEGEQAPS